MVAQQFFEELLAQAKNDENIIGLFLTGSRGKGFERSDSDYDLDLIVKDGAVEEYQKKYKELGVSGVDLGVSSLEHFRNYASWGSDDSWDRYNYAGVRALVDKTGEVQKILDEKGSIPETAKKYFINRNLDGYLNGVYRSLKARRKNDRAGMILEAAGSVPFFLNAIFAVHNRLAPFPDYLQQDLGKYPLKKLPLSSSEFLELLLAVVSTGDSEKQKQLIAMSKTIFEKEGFGGVFESWEKQLG